MGTATSITHPTAAVDQDKYRLECDFALEPAFRNLVNEAEKAGWDRLQIALSIINLCEDIIYGPEAAE
ncbi:hypothetical protein [Brucella sp. NBRC 12950]|jgi:hypothetical protein|uniref:hypothetical protein n=1 Tax=Brucella sp. NBRC 12950 TaxID=2994518 RepID=UPI0024A20484|nr:hypothetical protein [Brucella sp. NBRC 12950]GLU30000.1 hypothetical protein Brsp01_52330 [Brucella sp. NBRC 12950]